MKRREFADKVKLAAFHRAAGRCEKCSARLFIGKFHYDHVLPDAMGGEPTIDNCAVLCIACHAGKSATDANKLAKVRRVRAKHIGARKPSRFQGSRNSRLKKKVSGEVVAR